MFVPGHGAVANAQDLITFRDYLVVLRGAVQDLQAQGKADDAIVGAILTNLRKNYGAWAFFDGFARDNIRQTAEEFAGHKQLPEPGDGVMQ